MHPLPFALKRAHLTALRVVRKHSVPYGITPARFDLIYRVRAAFGRRILQRVLRRNLGLAASTLSRMLTQIESLGLITRTRLRPDKRVKVIELTKAGRAVIRRLLKRVIRAGILRQEFGEAFPAHPVVPLREPAFTEEVHRVAWHLKDSACPVRYPSGQWDPPCWDPRFKSYEIPYPPYTWWHTHRPPTPYFDSPERGRPRPLFA
jgi:DNA-binding MarR family transcriptional regulator